MILTSVQNASGKKEKKTSDSVFNTCLCKELMENVKKILFIDHKQKKSACQSNNCNVHGAKKELITKFI